MTAAPNTGGTTVDLSPLLQYGIVGFIAFLALAIGYALWRRELRDHDEHQARADRLEAELRKLNETVQTQLLVALQEATATAREVLTVVTMQDRNRRGTR